MDISITAFFNAKVTFDEVFIERQIAAWQKSGRGANGTWNNFHAEISLDDAVVSPELMCVVRIDEQSAQQNVYDCEIGVFAFNPEGEQFITMLDSTLRGYIRSPMGYLGRPIKSIVGVCELTRITE